jgi:hypothetical protein
MSEKQDTPRTGHTPGPWKVIHESVFNRDVSEKLFDARCCSIADPEVVDANLALAAAAPDLLRALEAALPSVRREANAAWKSANTTSVSERFRWTQEAERLDKIAEDGRAALAKAKGNTP